MEVSTGINCITDPTTLGSVAIVGESGTKTTKNHAKMLDQLYIPDRPHRFPAFLDQGTDLIWGQDGEVAH